MAHITVNPPIVDLLLRVSVSEDDRDPRYPRPGICLTQLLAPHVLDGLPCVGQRVAAILMFLYTDVRQAFDELEDVVFVVCQTEAFLSVNTPVSGQWAIFGDS